MNKYQKKLHKEIKEFKNDNKEISYQSARRWLKIMIKINPFTPCENCTNICHRKYKNKIAYCRWKK